MKISLSPAQSSRLMGLGVDLSKASGLKKDKPTRTNIKYYVFTLSDILSLLPKELIIEGCPYHLNIDYPYLTGGVAARYLDEEDDSLTWVLCPELIDALFELLCWVLQNHPDKIKKLER